MKRRGKYDINARLNFTLSSYNNDKRMSDEQIKKELISAIEFYLTKHKKPKCLKIERRL